MPDKKILSNFDNLGVSSNEFFIRHTINRSLKKLLENDQLLNRVKENLLSNLGISEYRNGITYRLGNIIWIKDSDNEGKLCFLRCIRGKNTLRPKRPFEKYGWEDLNPKLGILDFGIDKLVKDYIKSLLEKHERDLHYHPYGKIGDSEISEKLMKIDFSNEIRNRSKYFYPYETNLFSDESGSILNGLYRKWQNGILEYDIIFRMGTSDEELVCNTEKFMNGSQLLLSDPKHNQNNRYFYGTDDYGIFKSDGDGTSKINNILQKNRNDFLNVYSARLNFPAKFSGDDDYMIFFSDLTSQCTDADTNTIYPGKCCMTFCNKTRSGITAMLLTYAEDNQTNFATNGGLASNSFHCKVIGTWDIEV